MAEIDRSFEKRLQARKQVQEIERANRYLEGEGLRSLSVGEKEKLLSLLEQPQSKGELVPVQEPTTPSGLQSIFSVLKKKLPGGPAAALAKLVGPSIENKKVFRKRMEEAVKEAEESDKPLEDIMPFGDKIGVSLRAILELYNKGMTRREALKRGAGAAARAIAPPLPGLPKKDAATIFGEKYANVLSENKLKEAELQNRGKELARSFMDDIGYQWLIEHDPNNPEHAAKEIREYEEYLSIQPFWNFLDSPDWLLKQLKDHFFFSKKVKELQDMGYADDDIKKLFKIGMEHYQKDLPKKNTGGVIRNPYDGYSPRAI